MNQLITIAIFLLVLVGTDTLGLFIDQGSKAVYTICTARLQTTQVAIEQLYETIDDQKVKQILKLLHQGQQIDQSSKNYLDSFLMKKNLKLIFFYAMF